MKYFCEHKSRGTGAIQLKCSMGRKEGYIRNVCHVGNHSRPTLRSAYVIFNFSKLFFVVIRATFIFGLRGWGCLEGGAL